MPSCVCSPHACPHPLLQPQHQIRQAEKVLPSSLRGGVISVPSGGTLSPLLTSLASPPFPPASSAHLRGLHWHMPTFGSSPGLPPTYLPGWLTHRFPVFARLALSQGGSPLTTLFKLSPLPIHLTCPHRFFFSYRS